MRRPALPHRLGLLIPCAVAALSACAAPGAVAPAGSAAQPAPAVERPRATPAAADAAFVRHMIIHHAQALEMTDLAAERAPTPDVRLLAERMAVSQADEIAWMRAWLQRRGEPVPEEHAHHREEHASLPGMVPPRDMARLREASGTAFDRLFLQFMIVHHEGALLMVEELFAAGGGQETEIHRLAAEVDADQRAEIDRMRRMLDALSASGAP
jgi:uncharacterized protein (DUF305 family)